MLTRRTLSSCLVLFFILIFSTEAYACHWYDIWGLHGSLESRKKQNDVADFYGLERLSEKMIAEYIRDGKLMRLPDETDHFYLDIAQEHLKYIQPWTKNFAEDLAGHFFQKFKKRLKITSLVRSREYQAMLEKFRVSDADSSINERRSSHLTGAAFDVSRKDMTFWEKRWICRAVEYWKEKNSVEGIEERINNAFHIMVFPSYASSFFRKDEWDELADFLDKPFFAPKWQKRKSPARKRGF